MVDTGKEISGQEGNGNNIDGKPPNAEACSNSCSCREMRCVDMLQGRCGRILKYMMIWKPEWKHSKDMLRRIGWSMVEAAIMNPSQVEVPMGQFVKMNILIWNCRDALNPDFKRRVFEMAVNHHPSIMVITETRVGGTRGMVCGL